MLISRLEKRSVPYAVLGSALLLAGITGLVIACLASSQKIENFSQLGMSNSEIIFGFSSAVLILSGCLLYLAQRKVRLKKEKVEKSHSQEVVSNHSRIALGIGLFGESDITDIIMNYLDGATIEKFFYLEEGALIKRPLVARSLLRLGTLNVWRQFTIFNLSSWETHFSPFIKVERERIEPPPMTPSMRLIECVRVLSCSLKVQQDQGFTLLLIPKRLSIMMLYLAFKEIQGTQSKNLNLDIRPKGAPYLQNFQGHEYYERGSGLFGTGRRTDMNKYIEDVPKYYYILISNNVIEETCSQSATQQDKTLAKYGCRKPKIIEAFLITIVNYYFLNKKEIFSDCWYSRCEKGEREFIWLLFK